LGKGIWGRGRSKKEGVLEWGKASHMIQGSLQDFQSS